MPQQTKPTTDQIASVIANGHAFEEHVLGQDSTRRTFNLENNRRISPTDRRHRLVFNGVYDFARIRFAMKFLNGLRGQGGGGDRNILPTIDRNSDYVEWNHRFDFRVARDFPIGERARVEILGEAFNLFNISNYNGFLTTFYDGVATTTSTPVAQNVVLNRNNRFGQANNNSSQPDGTNARRFQLALRFRF